MGWFYMELFERIRVISTSVAGSQKKLAELLGIPQNTFQGYLKIERQDNLWPLLSQILKVLPMVSRDWLYFGEGEMLQSDAQTAPAPTQATPSPEMPSEIARLRAELDEANRLNRQLVTRLLVDGVGDKGASKNTAKKAVDGQ